MPQQRHTKVEAEAVLRELPSVLGAFVREDVYGHPREVHLLVRSGTVPRDLARDVRDMLEERLGVPVDQRVISIAQVAANGTTLEQAIGPAGDVAELPAPRRVVLQRVESSRTLGWIEARAVVRRGDADFEGAGREIESPAGAARAGARAVAAAITEAFAPTLSVHVETASLVPAFDREHVLVTLAAASPLFGRSVKTLVGAQPLTEDRVEAGALAVLKATNRVLELALASSDAA
ncbi:MAG TPA: hypothetical protein VF039_13365 [Longimicrobiales bacterium]